MSSGDEFHPDLESTSDEYVDSSLRTRVTTSRLLS